MVILENDPKTTFETLQTKTLANLTKICIGAEVVAFIL